MEKSSEEIAELFRRAKAYKPKTGAGLFEQQSAVPKLFGSFVIARQSEMAQLSGREVNFFRELTAEAY